MNASDLTRQQLCAALNISESTVRRLELLGLPYTPVGIRAKRYSLGEVKEWLRANQEQIGRANRDASTSSSRSAGTEFAAACLKVKLRVMPSR